MKNKLVRSILVASIAVVLLLSLAISVSAAGPKAGKGYNRTDTTAMGVRTTALTEAEKSSLILMREEEKLARDVYLYFYDKWQITVFNNIASSEQKHMDAVNKLLVKYGIPDPALGNSSGIFVNSELQALYEELIERGSQSLEEALQVGVLIENTDIADLQQGLAVTTQRDINNVYSNLLKASYKHLDAFNTELSLLAK